MRFAGEGKALRAIHQSATALLFFRDEAGEPFNGPGQVRITQLEDAAIEQTINSGGL